MVKLDQVERGAAAWLDHEVFPHLPSGGQFDELRRAAATAMAVYIIRRGRPALESILGNPFLAAIGAVNEHNELDIAGLKEVFAEQIPDKGLPVRIPLLPEITLYKSDLDKLYQYITAV